MDMSDRTFGSARPGSLARRAAVALALACRPPPEPARPEPRGPPPLYLATGDRLYTAGPVGDGDAFVPVTEKILDRRAGDVLVHISYPEVDLPDDDRKRELAAAIRDAAGLDAWLKADGKD